MVIFPVNIGVTRKAAKRGNNGGFNTTIENITCVIHILSNKLRKQK